MKGRSGTRGLKEVDAALARAELLLSGPSVDDEWEREEGPEADKVEVAIVEKSVAVADTTSGSGKKKRVRRRKSSSVVQRDGGSSVTKERSTSVVSDEVPVSSLASREAERAELKALLLPSGEGVSRVTRTSSTVGVVAVPRVKQTHREKRLSMGLTEEMRSSLASGDEGALISPLASGRNKSPKTPSSQKTAGKVPSSAGQLDGETRRTAMEVFGEGGMVEFGQVSRFLVLRGVAVDTLSVDAKVRLVDHFAQMQRCSGEDFAKLIDQTRGRPWGAAEHPGFFAGMEGRGLEWKSAFLNSNAIGVLANYLIRIEESEGARSSARQWFNVHDVVRCLGEVALLDKGTEQVMAHERCLSLLLETLDLQQDSGQVDTVAFLSAFAQKRQEGLLAILVVIVKEGRQAMEKLLSIMERSSASRDLRIKALAFLTSLLSYPSAVWHAKLLVVLMRCNFSLRLDAMLDTAPDDGDLATAIKLLRDRNPEFRRKDPQAIFHEICDGFKDSRPLRASFANILEHLSKLEPTEPVWNCVEGFFQTLAMTPIVSGDAKGWFAGVVSRYASPEARVDSLNSKIAMLQAQIDTRRASDGGGSDAFSARTNVASAPPSARGHEPLFDLREGDESADESSEFVDIAGDGVRAPAGASVSRYHNLVREKDVKH